MCLQPFSKQVRSNPHSPVYSILVPCGKCIECLRQYQNGWIVRLFTEALQHPNLLFFTLTYNADKVPELVTSDGLIVRTVYKKHVQDWLKRFRRNFERANGTIKEFKYFITSEYGPKTLRPHSHGLIFGISLKDFKRYALSDWEQKFGFYQCNNITIATDQKERDKHLNNTIRYVSKYCLKGDQFENPFVLSGEVYPTFHLISNGIGRKYIDDLKKYLIHEDHSKFNPQNIAYLAENSSVKIGNYKYPLPRYFKSLLYGDKTLLSLKIANYVRQSHDDVYLSQFKEVQSKRNWSDIQTFRYLAMQKECTKRLETERQIADLSKFYNKSKF